MAETMGHPECPDIPHGVRLPDAGQNWYTVGCEACHRVWEWGPGSLEEDTLEMWLSLSNGPSSSDVVVEPLFVKESEG